MSLQTVKRVKQTPSIWDKLTTEQKNNIHGWCPISDEILRKENPTAQDLDKVAVEMTDEQFAKLMKDTMEEYEKRKLRRRIARNYAASEGREDLVKKIDAEQQKDDEAVLVNA